MRLFRAIAVIVLLVVTGASYAALDLPYDVYIEAWNDAVRYAQVKKKYLPKPPLVLWEPKLIYESCHDEYDNHIEECFSRTMAHYSWEIYVKKGGDLDIREAVYIHIYESEHAECPGFLHELLTHEFLHYLYFRKALTEKGFEEANPDEHEWVESVFTPDAFCWGTTTDAERTEVAYCIDPDTETEDHCVMY